VSLHLVLTRQTCNTIVNIRSRLDFNPGLSPTNKKPWIIPRIPAKIFSFTDVPIKNSHEKYAEILPASSTKKLVKKCFWFQEKFENIKYLNLSKTISELRFFFLTGLSPGLLVRVRGNYKSVIVSQHLTL
jgi:hypothetical protein